MKLYIYKFTPDGSHGSLVILANSKKEADDLMLKSGASGWWKYERAVTIKNPPMVVLKTYLWR